MFVDFVNTIEEYETKKEILIFPNPTTGKINVQCNRASTIEIFDIYGRCLYKKPVSDLENLIDISTFSQGTYYIRIFNKDDNLVSKIIRQ